MTSQLSSQAQQNVPSTPTKGSKSAASSVQSASPAGAKKSPPKKLARKNVDDAATGAQDQAQEAAPEQAQAPKKTPKKLQRRTEGAAGGDQAEQATDQAKQATAAGAGDDGDPFTDKAPTQAAGGDNEDEGGVNVDNPAEGGEQAQEGLQELAPEAEQGGDEHQDDETTESYEEVPEPGEQREVPADDQQSASGSATGGKSGGGLFRRGRDAVSGVARGLGGGSRGDGPADVGKQAQDVAQGTAQDVTQTAQDTAGGATDNLPVDLSILKGLQVGEGGQILDKSGNAIGKVAEGDPEDLVGQTVGDNGEILDEDGDLIGRVEALPEAAQQATGAVEGVKDNLPDLKALDGLPVGEGGEIKDKAGNVLGKVVEGDPEDLVGQTVNDQGEILDEDGDLIGRVEVVPQQAKDAVGDVKDQLPSLKDLAGLPVSEGGEIKDKAGNVIGKVVEGDPEDLIGQTVNEKGEILDEEGDLIGRVETVAPEGATEGITDKVDEAKDFLPKDLAGLKGLPVAEGGEIKDKAGHVVGKVVEGEPEDLVGQTVQNDGEILDEEGDLIGRVEVLSPEEAAKALGGKVEDVKDQAGEATDKLVPDFSILSGRKVNKKGNILDEEGEVIGKVAEGTDLSAVAGKLVNEKGEVVDKKGNVLGKVEIVPGEAADDAMKALQEQAGDVQDTAEGAVPSKVQEVLEKGLAALDGLQVNEEGKVVDSEGNVLAEIDSGKLEDAVGKTVNEHGLIVDDEGNIVGRVALVKGLGEKAQEAAGEALPDLSTLEGLTVNKQGRIIRDDGTPVGELIEGDPKKLSRLGVRLDDKGQFWDNRGNVIGRAKTIPIEEKETEGPFSGLEDLIVVQDGFVVDGNNNRVGKIVEGDAKKLVGRAVDEDGDVLDKNGNVVGHAERYEEPEAEPEPEPEKPDFSIVEGLTANKQGNVIGPQGVPIARVVEGNPKEVAGKKIDAEGQIWNDAGKVIGRVEIIPESERETKPEGIFAGLEGLVVNKDGFVEDEEGNIVGKLVEGDAKRLRGRAVDEDGDILDKYGNVKGRAEPYEPPEEEKVEEDLSALEGKTVNKAGNVVDEAGTVYGRIVSGDPKKMAGRKVDGKGQVWSDDGKVIGRAELIPGGEKEKPEGPFYGFENLVVGKDGVINDSTGKIVGRLVDGDPKRLQGRAVDEDGDILDKNGNTIGHAERWEPEEKKRDVNPMSGRKVNREGEVRDADGNLIGKLTEGNLKNLIGKSIDDNGYVVDNDGNKIGECTLIENLPEPEPEEPQLSPEEQEKLKQQEEDKQIAKKIISIVSATIDKIEPICKQITEAIEKADRTPKDELDEEKLVQEVKPLIEEGGRILQECNGSIRALDPDGRIAATAKARAAAHEATPEEYRLADMLKTLTSTVVTTIDKGRKRIQGMPHAKKKLNPLWALLSEPLFQIIAAVGLLLSGVLGLVGRLLDGLGLGGLVRGLLGGLGIDKLLGGLGLSSITDSLGLTGKK